MRPTGCPCIFPVRYCNKTSGTDGKNLAGVIFFQNSSSQNLAGAISMRDPLVSGEIWTL